MNVIVNIYIYLFRLADAYFLSGNPEHVVLADNVTVILTCVTEDDNAFVSCTKDARKIADIQDDCVYNNIPDNTLWS
jgi:hypothetical protein